MSSKSYTPRQRQNWVRIVALLCGLGGVLYGYDIGVISGALTFMQHAIALSDFQLGLVVGAMFIGGLVGTLLAGPVADYCGRRYAVMLACVLFATGVVFILIAHSFIFLFLARLLLGAGIGVVAVAVPLYVAELVPSEKRGRYVTFFQLFLTFGIVLAYAVDFLLTPSGDWRAMFAVVLAPACILFLAMCFLPESPRWLVGKGRRQQALAVLKRTHSADRAVAEVHAMGLLIRGNSVQRWRDIVRSVRWGVLLLAISVAVLNQGTGINAVLQYAPEIFHASGIATHWASMLGAIGIGLLQLIATCVAVWLVDLVGRRPLMLLGTCGMLCMNLLLVIVNMHYAVISNNGMFSMLGLFGFVMFYALGPGVVVWLVISELFPTAVRAKGMALCLFFNSLTGSVLTTIFPVLQHVIGIAGIYAVCAVSSLAYAVVVFLFLPETKDYSLEQIEQVMR